MIHACSTITGDSNSPEYRFDSIVNKSLSSLFIPVQTLPNSDPPKVFPKLKFDNKRLDAIRLSNILNHKSVCSKILPNFKNTKPSRPIASKMFNYAFMSDHPI